MNLSKQKIKLLVGCAVQIWINSEVFAHFELDDFDIKAHTSHYNSLPSVEENNERLKNSPQFSTVLKKAEEIVTRYDLNDYISLRLIHTHYLLNDNQIMGENYKREDEIPSLVTSPYSLEEA